MSNERRFLVTGGAGFIGSHLVEALLARGHEVVVLDDLSTGRRENLEAAVAGAARVNAAGAVARDGEAGGASRADAGAVGPATAAQRLKMLEGSLLDADALADAVNGVDVVMHQAAIPSVPRSFADPVATMRANAEGTTALLEACRKAGVRRIAMASSSSVYGDTPTLPKDESMAPNPMSPYALSKLTAEQAGGIFARTYGMQVYALRYFNVFGPRQDPTSQYSAVIPKFITCMAEGRAPTIFGDGLQSRDFTYIDNVVHANLLAGGVHEGEQGDDGTGGRADPGDHDDPGDRADPGDRDDPGDRGDPGGRDGESAAGGFHVLNIGCGTRHTLLDLVAALNDIIGTDLAPQHDDPRPGDVRHSHAAIERARAVLGFEPRVDFAEGLRRTAAFYAR